MAETIKFTPDKVTKLKAEYKKAVDDGVTSFIFEGHELLVSYAKYLIEYLDTVF